MPCWPDVWRRITHSLPTVRDLGFALGYVGLVALLLWAPRVRKPWLRIASRILGAASLVPVAILLPALALGFMLRAGDPPTQVRTVRSTDGQEATLRYDAGFLGRDYTEVTLKRSGCCQHDPVFWHAGPSWFDDVQIEWLDNRHLHLTYHARRGDAQHCQERVGDTNILCSVSLSP